MSGVRFGRLAVIDWSRIGDCGDRVIDCDDRFVFEVIEGVGDGERVGIA